MQTINKVLLLLIAVGGLFFWWRKEQSTAEFDRQVGALATTLDRRFILPDTPPAQAEAMFLRAMVIFSDYRTLLARGRIRTSEDEYLKAVLAAAGYTSEREIGMIARSLQQNLSLCQQMKIIPETEGTHSLLTGQAPVIRAGSFRGDTLTLSRHLPAALAPDLANHPANYALVPASAAAMIWPYTLSDNVLRAAGEFKSEGLLDARIHDELKQRTEVLKKPK